MTVKEAARHINERGCLLVFPLANRKEPASLWSCFFPRSEMRWEWDDGGDRRVANLWHLREQLSRSNKVVYAKWFRGRATFFSRELFTALLKALNPAEGELVSPHLDDSPALILERLRESSPQSTKALKEAAGLKGRAQESAYSRALKALWDRLLIVGYGEIEDGAFPSLAMGATELLFEELWREARKLSDAEALKRVEGLIPPPSLFYQYFRKLRAAKAPARKKRPNVIYHSELSLRGHDR